MKNPVYFHTLILISVLGVIGCAKHSTVSTVQTDKNVQEPNPFDPDRPPTAKTLFVMADMLAAQGRDPEAELLLERILKEHPDYFPAYNTLAEIQMRRRQIPNAIKTLSAGLQLNPNDAILLNNTGMCWLIRKDYTKALEYFTQAAGILPENTRYRSNMATALVLLGRCDEALTLYEQILPKEEAAENIRILCTGANPTPEEKTSSEK